MNTVTGSSSSSYFAAAFKALSCIGVDTPYGVIPDLLRLIMAYCKSFPIYMTARSAQNARINCLYEVATDDGGEELKILSPDIGLTESRTVPVVTRTNQLFLFGGYGGVVTVFDLLSAAGGSGAVIAGIPFPIDNFVSLAYSAADSAVYAVAAKHDTWNRTPTPLRRFDIDTRRWEEFMSPQFAKVPGAVAFGDYLYVAAGGEGLYRFDTRFAVGTLGTGAPAKAAKAAADSDPHSMGWSLFTRADVTAIPQSAIRCVIVRSELILVPESSAAFSIDVNALGSGRWTSFDLTARQTQLHGLLQLPSHPLQMLAADKQTGVCAVNNQSVWMLTSGVGARVFDCVTAQTRTAKNIKVSFVQWLDMCSLG